MPPTHSWDRGTCAVRNRVETVLATRHTRSIPSFSRLQCANATATILVPLSSSGGIE